MSIMDKFGQAKDMLALQKKARAIQKELKDTLIESEELEGKVKVTVTGEQKVEEIEIAESLLSPENKKQLEISLRNALTQALARSQQIAAEKMKAVAGDLGLPGL